jgi:hypothetical protein
VQDFWLFGNAPVTNSRRIVTIAVFPAQRDVNPGKEL